MSFFRSCLLLGYWALVSLIGVRGATVPAGFVEQDVGSGWSEAVGLAFGKNADGTKDRTYVWERAGRVWIVENGVKLSIPLLDIREEVGGWRDYGLLGFALDPNFQTNGHFYVLYVVDRHHLMKFGTAQYSATTNEYFAATIGRLTRYTARRADDFRTADPASRRILVGETKSTGFPILHQSHGTGSLVFGTDGTLLAACGDGASYEAMDNGGTAGNSYGPQALADGIITAAENIGAFRCQLLDSLSGKVVRIDPSTGDGVASNPWYQSGSPRSARSRVWAYGLRNPMRMTLKPGTGQHDPAAGAPGVLFIGDVGWGAAEDMEVADGPGKNFGWPLYEGYNQNSSYWNVRPSGMNAADWVKPRSSWRSNASVLTPGGAVQRFGAAGTTVPGPNFSGNCSIGGVWYTGTDFPAEWRNVYFHAEYGGQWIRAFSMDASHFVTSQRGFLTGAPITCVATHPETGGLYYASWGGGVKKISYAPAGNQAPTAVATVSHTSGASPLAVAFSSLGSRDPESGALSYAWDFGDGTTSTEAHPVKTYTASNARAFTATLTVRDPANATATASVVVTINNTAPTVIITSPAAGASFPLSGPAVTVPLTATVTAPGHAAAALTYRWQTFLYHNTHFHGEPEQTTATGSLVVTPLAPTAIDSYFYKVVLTVTDPLGARTTVERLLLPAAGTTGTPPFAALGTPPSVVGAAFSVPITFSEPVTGLVAGDFSITNGTATALNGTGAAYSLSITPAAAGPVTLSLPAGTCVDAENLANAVGLPVSTFFLPAPPPPNRAPSVVTPASQSTERGRSATLAIDATDPDGDDLSYSATGLPAGLTINAATGVISGSVATTAADNNTVTVTVNDGSLSGTTSFTWLTTAPPPVSPGPGLKGEYFAGENFATPALTRIDSRLEFYWPGTASPGPGVPGDYFSTRWTGRLTVPTTGSWQFFADVDDGLRLWVNGQLVLDKWNPPPAVYWGLASTPLTLTAGVAYDFKLEYQDFFSDAYLNFRWAGPGTPQQGVPATAFSQPPSGPDTTPPAVTLTGPATATVPFTVDATFSEPVTGLSATDFIVTNGAATTLTGSAATYAVTITPAADGPVTVRLPAAAAIDAATNPSLASNQLEVVFAAGPPPTAPGLKGEYFAGENFATPALTRIDSRLEFYWPGTASPGPGVPGDYFSTRWTGRLTVPTTGSWQFFADVDDGLRLWVNGQLVLDKWNPPPAVYWGLASTPLTLTAGVAYDFKLEYQDFFSDAYLNFRWAGPGTPQQGVPATAFSQPPSGPDTTPPAVTLTGPATATVPFTVAATFSEPVTGLNATDFIVTNGAATTLTGSAATYAVTITPAADGPVTVRLPAAAAIDAATNPSLASNQLEVVFAAGPPPTAPGLKGEYFAGENFATPALTRVDSRLEFYWPGTASPGPGVPGDYFSTRWTGRLTVPTTGSWQFFADVDDGLRLWVNGQLVLDKWNPPPAVYWGLASTPLTLTAGVAYDFKLEYQDFFSDSYLVLRWAGPGTPQQGVPATAFSQPANAIGASVATSDENEASDPLVDGSAQAAMTAAFNAAQADLPRLERTLVAVPQDDGTVEIQFTRSPALRLATVLQGSDDMTHWHDIRDPGWPVTVLPDGLELVRIPRACCLLSDHDGASGYFRLRAGP